jgi:hypothetical protein
MRSYVAYHWDLSVYLVADTRIESAWRDYLAADLPDDPGQRQAEIERRITHARRGRYLEGQKLYEQEAQPAASPTSSSTTTTSPIHISRFRPPGSL